MGHDHDHSHSHRHVKEGRLKTAFVLNLAFTLVELVGGLLTNSVAILADAIHDLGDSLSLGLATWFDSLARKGGRTNRFTYGYDRFTLLSALINGLVLTVGSVLVLLHAIPRLFDPEPPHVAGMIGFAVLGVVVNGAAMVATRSGKTLNERLVSWHLLEDVLGWVAVLVGSVVIQLTGYLVIDAILAVAISSFILLNVFRKLKEAMVLFLQGAPQEPDVTQIQEAVQAIEGIQSIHDVHLWSLDGEKTILTLHVVLDDRIPPTELMAMRDRVKERLQTFQLDQITLELEGAQTECALRDEG